MGKCIIRLAALGVVASVGTGTARAQDSFTDAFWQYRASAGFDYSSGHYGATTTTDVMATSATFQASKGPWTIKASVPWLHVDGPALLLDDTDTTSGTATAASRHESGLGDVVLYGRYSIQSLYPTGWLIDIIGKLKLPTASFSKGLGTGKTDGGGQIDIAKAFGNWMPFISAGYRIDGSPAGYTLRNIVYGTAGLQYTWSQRFLSGVYFDYRQAALTTAADPRELTAYVNVRVTGPWWVQVYGVAGFSQNSPGAGGGIVITYRWP